MNNIRNFIKGLITCGAVLALASTLNAQNAIPGKAKVIRIKGSARYTAGNNVWQPLKVGDTLRAGTVIQTGLEKGSFVDLILSDGNAPIATSKESASTTSAPPPSTLTYQAKNEQNYVRVWENTVLGIDKLTSLDTGADQVTDTQLDLKVGHITGNVKKMSAASKYEVKLPNGVAGIRGTLFDITSEGVVKVSSGSVVLAYVGTDQTVVTQVINGGQQFDARTGQLTPLSASAIGDMELFARDMRGGGAGAPVNMMAEVETQLALDHTIYRAHSPHHKKHKH